MKHRSRRALAVLTVLCSLTFQNAACSLTDMQVKTSVNSAAQGFLNSLFAQWIGVKVDGLFDVE